MSRREGRESDSRRHRSKYDREPSPKRYRRDGKPATERKPSNFDVDLGDHAAREQKHHRRRLQDAAPLEAPLPPDFKEDSGPVNNKESDKKTGRRNEGTVNSSNPTELPRPRSYFQHDERGSAGQDGRSRVRRATTERGWWRDPKDKNDERVPIRTASHDMHQKEKSQALREDNRVWRHDGFFEMEGSPPRPPSVRKRPAFRENKMQPVETKDAGRVTTEPAKSSHLDRPTLGSKRRADREGHREDREGRAPRSFERSERPFARERPPPNRGRYSAAVGDYRGREKFNEGRHQGARSVGNHAEKWKHDMFAEANRSPTPKNEEDQIAKVEALLAS